MNLAAVEIGSNAVRLLIARAIKETSTNSFKTIEFIRVPLRLGEDIFKDNRISPEKEKEFIELMQAFQVLIRNYKVERSRICASHEILEAVNGMEIIKKAGKLTGMKIEILSPEDEAELIFNVLLKTVDNWQYLHINVGGGNTELNIISKKRKVASAIFKVGSIRNETSNIDKKEWTSLRTWIKSYSAKFSELYTLGTGGNILKIFTIAGLKAGQSMSFTKFSETINLIKNCTVEDRINKMKLNPDRAELIIPTSDICLSVMRWANSGKIIVPQVGLKEGILHKLYESENMKK